MPKPKGVLTGTQLELMKEIWDRGKDGITVRDLWQSLSATRTVARTTVQTMLSRLHRRGWLRRKTRSRAHYYSAACDPDQVSARLATDFLQEYFEGSAAQLVMSLLGSEQVTAGEVKRLRRLLKESKEGKR